MDNFSRERCLKMRLQREWTQRELAARAGVSLSVLRNFENGYRNKPVAANIERIRAALMPRGSAPATNTDPTHMKHAARMAWLMQQGDVASADRVLNIIRHEWLDILGFQGMFKRRLGTQSGS